MKWSHLDKWDIVHWLGVFNERVDVWENLLGLKIHLVGKERFLVGWYSWDFKYKNSIESINNFRDNMGRPIKCQVFLGFGTLSKDLRVASFMMMESSEMNGNGGNISTAFSIEVIGKPKLIFDHIDCQAVLKMRVQPQMIHLLVFWWSDKETSVQLGNPTLVKTDFCDFCQISRTYPHITWY